ncbi:MAG: hypothetical protein JWR33_1053 [Naasia sp.]|jgi:hypothetical protein|uniref:hypothetical protein n=1 Tax=Naasia sp. TaxID=2546198 RepID=UPI00262ACB57|nr:hypothetical protein [Naasia sp.]MCU1570312.1 hypothetical protein [Naasia sp.]
MKAIARIWIAFAALGAGLVHLAVAAGAPPLLLVVFSLLGLAELAWFAAALRLSHFPVRRLALVGSLLALVIWAAAVLAGGGIGVTVDNLPPFALASASALDVVVAVTMAVSLRRAPRLPGDVDVEPRAGRLLLGVLAGAALMTAVALPALGQTEAGIAALGGPHAHHQDLPTGHTGH